MGRYWDSVPRATPFLARLLEKVMDRHPPITDWQRCQLQFHFDLLVKWNKRINLTRIEGLEDVVVRHYWESIALGDLLPFRKIRIMDVGSGGGFPGVVLAITRPDAYLYLVESDARKAAFLREATQELPNCQVLKFRVEVLEQGVDWVVSRGIRWEITRGAAERLADNVAYMTTTEGVREITGKWPIRWSDPVPLPSGGDRVILLGKLLSADHDGLG